MRATALCLASLSLPGITAILLFALQPLSDDDPTTHVAGLGSLRGKLADGAPNVLQFLRVPYAQAPVGELRWRAPEAHGPWAGTLDAREFGPACMGGLSQQRNHKVSEESEDCLFLNIFAPASAVGAGRRLPVLVWIHGGDFDTGTPSDYPGQWLVQRSGDSVVVVSIAYRLNVFGFLGGAAVSQRAGDGSAGNFGMEDQRLALSWVRSHIQAFGGNGTDLTIFGQSSGGASVLQHLVQRTSWGLYSKAIVMSGAYDGTVLPGQAERDYEALLAATSCSSLSCLANLPAKEVYTHSRKVPGAPNPVLRGPWGPVGDSQASDLIAQGNYNTKVPVTIGSARDDAVQGLYLPYDDCPINLTQDGLEPCLQRLGLTNEALPLYMPNVYSYPKNLSNRSQQWWTTMRMATDAMMGACTHRRVARSLVRGGTPATYYYLFAEPLRSGDDAGTVPHGSELNFLFSSDEELDKREASFAATLSGYWLQFAATGEPNGPSLLHWPSYSTEADEDLRLRAEDSDVQQRLRKEACDFWDGK